jgi:hypothetical protein
LEEGVGAAGVIAAAAAAVALTKKGKSETEPPNEIIDENFTILNPASLDNVENEALSNERSNSATSKSKLSPSSSYDSTGDIDG